MVTTLSQQHIPIYNGGQKNLGLCERKTDVVAPKSTEFTHFSPNTTLLEVGGEGSLVLVISLEKFQHF